MSDSRPLRVGIDIGGTFTDLLLVDDRTGEASVVKILTTPDDPSAAVEAAVADALGRAGAAPSAVRHVVHGTTLVTNAIIERKGARTALITTRGFRDTLEIRREHRYDMYDLFLEPPPPLVPRHLRFEIDERVLADGSVLRAPSRQVIAQLVEAIAARGIEAIAVSLLHAYQNPAHERLVGEVIAECAPAVQASLSSEVAPEMKEYERTSTTVCNVYVQALVERYLAEIERKLGAAGVDGQLLVMMSSGGLATVETSRRFPIRLLESGPAAGALAAAHVGGRAGFADLLSFDMGGTTAKVCVIEQGAPLRAAQFEVDRVYRFKKGSGLPVRTPVVELIEIGAGGGSIARVDALGRLKIGPDSAGAQPGPAGYGRGGVEATVTDADLVLGYLDPGFFLGGRMRLDLSAARAAIARAVATPLELSVEQAAWGIHQIVNENMANAARIHAVDRGKDPRAFPLFAFGGAGPVHACGVASILGIRTIIVPLGAGVGSTLGCLSAPPAFEFARTSLEPLDRVDWTRAERIRQEMLEEGVALLTRAGGAREDLTIAQSVDLRYVGQGYDIPVPLTPGPYDRRRFDEINRRFPEIYTRLYGRVPGRQAIETVSWRLVVSGPAPHLAIQPAKGAGAEASAALKGQRPVYFHRRGGYLPTPIYDRERLGPGAAVRGPAIVEERESTVVIAPGWLAHVDAAANLLLNANDED